MRRALAVAWLIIVVGAGIYLTILGNAGFSIRTDLLALLPREERDPVAQRANEVLSRSVGRRILLVFGDTDRMRARAAAQQAANAVDATGLVDSLNGALLQETGGRLATFYFPFREGLLSASDRAALSDGHAGDVANRALGQIFGFASPVSGGLIAADPFLLLPSFLSELPTPLGRLALDDGMLTVVDAGLTWVVVPMTLRHDYFNLDIQDSLVTAVDSAIEQIAKTMPDVKVLRAGAIFYADQGARTAIDETTLLTIIEIIGTVLLIVGVFCRLSPLLINLLALAVGIAVAFAGTFLIFGEIHVAALLFGTSLIGVAVDYGLHYCATAFGTQAATGEERLATVMPAIAMGLATTLVGYAALAIAPFPGLRQIAVFAIIGLVGSFATVTLWFPLLDRLAPLRHGAHLLHVAALPWAFWTDKRYRIGRVSLVVCAFATLTAGLGRYHTDDDVRRLQALSPSLLSQQDQIKRLILVTTEAQHVLVVAPSDEAALQRQESLIPIFDQLIAEHAIAGYQSAATFVPSLARQSADRALIKANLVGPLGAGHMVRLGLTAASRTDQPEVTLTVAGIKAAGVMPLLSNLIVEPGVHIVTLQGLSRPDLVKTALADQPEVRFVDPTADFSRLLGAYRSRAIVLTVISVVLVSGLLAWRYGVRGAFWTILPPIVAALLVPAVISLSGEPFTFFHAMGLVLVVAIGVDYTVFCAETSRGHHSVTMLAILLATITTLLSFGLLSASSALAVRAFGTTMLIGISAAYLFAPLASRAAIRTSRP